MDSNIKQLAALLQTKDLNNIEFAADSLLTLAYDKEETRPIIISHAIRPLVNLLSSNSETVKEKASAVLKVLSVNDTVTLVKEEGIEPLFKLISSFGSSRVILQNASAILKNLSTNKSNSSLLLSADKIKCFIDLLSKGIEQATENAAGAVCNLSSNVDYRVSIAKRGIEPLINLLNFGSTVSKENAAGAVRNLAANIYNQEIIAKNGGIKPLVNLLSNGSERAKEQAAGALLNLADNNDNKVTIAKEGGIKPLINLLSSGSEATKERAACALWELAINNDNKVIIAKEGGVQPLTQLLSSKSEITKEKAAQILKILLENKKPSLFVSPDLSAVPSNKNTDLTPPWFVDSPGLNALPSHKKYHVISAEAADTKRVAEWYQKRPVPGYEIKSVQVVHNRNMGRAFELRAEQLNTRHGNPAFKPRWESESKSQEEQQQRSQVMEVFQRLSKPHYFEQLPHVSFLPLWHGTSPAILESIFTTGYANLASTDAGFFGKGLYNTTEPEYAHRVYSHGALVINWVAVFSAFPVIGGDESKVEEKGNYQNYDAHFVPVFSDKHPNTSVYRACKRGQPHIYTELVVFDTAQVLPRYVVEIQKSLLPPPPHFSSTTAATPLLSATLTTSILLSTMMEYQLSIDDNSSLYALIDSKVASYGSQEKELHQKEIEVVNFFKRLIEVPPPSAQKEIFHKKASVMLSKLP